MQFPLSLWQGLMLHKAGIITS